MILHSLQVDPKDLSARTGWTLKPDGLCKADRCVDMTPSSAQDGMIDARALSERLGMALLADDRHSVWALGPEEVYTHTHVGNPLACAAALVVLDEVPKLLARAREAGQRFAPGPVVCCGPSSRKRRRELTAENGSCSEAHAQELLPGAVKNLSPARNRGFVLVAFPAGCL